MVGGHIILPCLPKHNIFHQVAATETEAASSLDCVLRRRNFTVYVQADKPLIIHAILTSEHCLLP